MLAYYATRAAPTSKYATPCGGVLCDVPASQEGEVKRVTSLFHVWVVLKRSVCSALGSACLLAREVFKRYVLSKPFAPSFVKARAPV